MAGAAAPTPGTTIASDAGQSRRFVGHDDIGPDRRQGPGDADHVRGAVVQDRDLDRVGHPSDPFVEAGP